VSQTYQYPHMLMQLAQAGFSLGHVADMNYLVRPVSHASISRGLSLHDCSAARECCISIASHAALRGHGNKALRSVKLTR
jgi:hypothetical protein